ncbi:MAG: hypothetical protein M3517_00405 [Actinomycetota bacterium]|nr:hypothetical protein [Actinomycetota bacterium]
MSESLPPPIGANRIEDDDDASATGGAPSPGGLSTRTRVVGAVVALALAITAGVVAVRVIGGNEGGGDSDVGRWNAIAIRDDETITIVDEAGEELDTIEAAVGIGATEVSGRFLLASGDGEMLFVDTASGDTTAVEVSDEFDTARFLAPGSSTFALGSNNGGALRIVDPIADADVDITTLSGWPSDTLILPQAARIDSDNEVVGVDDLVAQQAVFFEIGEDPEPHLVDGRLIDLRHGAALGLEPEEGRAELTFYDSAGEATGSVKMAPPVGAVLTSDDTALVVDREGTLVELTAGNDEPRTIAELDLEPSSAVFATASDRIVLAVPGAEGDDDEVVVVDYDGVEILSESGTIAHYTGISVDSLACVVIGTPADGDDTAIGSSNAVLYDLDSGDELASGEIRFQRLSTASQDGCTVLAATADGALALTRDGTTTLDGEPAAVAPDGSAFVLRDGSELTLVVAEGGEGEGGEGDEVVELPGTGAPAFIER